MIPGINAETRRGGARSGAQSPFVQDSCAIPPYRAPDRTWVSAETFLRDW